MRSLYLGGLLALVAPVAASAQDVLHGVVREQGSGNPVAGAQVGALPRGPIAWTDMEGRFRLSATVRPDSLRVVAIGYGATRVAVTPDPFGGATIPVAISAKTIHQQSFGSDDELRGALRHASSTILRGEVAGS